MSLPESKKRKAPSSNCLAVQLPDVAKQWHPTKNGALTAFDVSPGSNKKVWWQCNKGTCCAHEWQASVNDRKRGRGCPWCCQGSKRVCIHNSLAGKFPNIAREWHPTKNADMKHPADKSQPLVPETASPHSNFLVWWRCPNLNCKEGCFHDYTATIAPMELDAHFAATMRRSSVITIRWLENTQIWQKNGIPRKTDIFVHLMLHATATQKSGGYVVKQIAVKDAFANGRLLQMIEPPTSKVVHGVHIKNGASTILFWSNSLCLHKNGIQPRMAREIQSISCLDRTNLCGGYAHAPIVRKDACMNGKPLFATGQEKVTNLDVHGAVILHSVSACTIPSWKNSPKLLQSGIRREICYLPLRSLCNPIIVHGGKEVVGTNGILVYFIAQRMEGLAVDVRFVAFHVWNEPWVRSCKYCKRINATSGQSPLCAIATERC